LNQIRKKIRKIIKENFLIGEAKKEISELENDFALFITKKGVIVNFIIYNTEESEVKGLLSMYKNNNMENYSVSAVAAEKGFGSLMYEIAMTYIYPLGIMPSRDGDVREGAFNIYEKFFDRKDVQKTSIPETSPDFSEDIANDFSEEEIYFHILQTIYKFSFGKEKLNNLLKNARKFDENQIKNIIEQSKNFFENKYI
jgi:hypothetical protein